MLMKDIKKDPGGNRMYGKMYSELFGKELDVIIKGGEEMIQYAEKCADYLNHFPDELLAELKKYSLRYCEDMRGYFDPECPEVPENVTEDTILDYARANCLIVEPPQDDGIIGFGVEFSCVWEPEHGMEWIVRDGRVLYVADFMGISPWYDDRVYSTECRSYVFEDFIM